MASTKILIVGALCAASFAGFGLIKLILQLGIRLSKNLKFLKKASTAEVYEPSNLPRELNPNQIVLIKGYFIDNPLILNQEIVRQIQNQKWTFSSLKNHLYEPKFMASIRTDYEIPFRLYSKDNMQNIEIRGIGLPVDNIFVPTLDQPTWTGKIARLFGSFSKPNYKVIQRNSLIPISKICFSLICNYPLVLMCRIDDKGNLITEFSAQHLGSMITWLRSQLWIDFIVGALCTIGLFMGISYTVRWLKGMLKNEKENKICDEFLCICCFTNPREVIYVDCKHLELCRSCYEQGNKICGICRVRTLNTVDLIYKQ